MDIPYKFIIPTIGPLATKTPEVKVEKWSTTLPYALIFPSIGPMAKNKEIWEEEAATYFREQKEALEKEDQDKKEALEKEALEQEAREKEALEKEDQDKKEAQEKEEAAEKKELPTYAPAPERPNVTLNIPKEAARGADGSSFTIDDHAASKSFEADIKSSNSMFNLSNNKERMAQVSMALEQLKIFSEYVSKRHERWKSDLEKIIENGTKSINDVNQDLIKASTGKATIEDRLVYHIKRLLRAYGGRSSVNLSMMKDFYVIKNRKLMRVLLNFIHCYQEKDNELGKFAIESKKSFDEYTKIIKDSHDELYKLFMKGLDILSGKYSGVDDDKRNKVTKMIDDTFDKLRNHRNKINSLYELKYSLLEMIIDSQFYVIYVIKALRILFAYVALFLTTRMFVPIYEDTVYDAKKDPPGLWKYMLIYLAFDFSLNVFLLVLLYLIKYLFKTDDNTFVVDSTLVGNYTMDYVIAMVIIMIIGILVGRVIVQKKYFKYKYEGVRAIRAFEKIVFTIAIVNIIVPYYLIL